MKDIRLKITIIFSIIILFTNSGYASKSETQIKLKIGQSYVKINNEVVKVQAAPYIKSGMTMVPLKVITDAFGARLEYDSKRNWVRIVYMNKNVKLTMGSAKAIIDGVSKSILCAPEVKKNTIMVPVRVISENFNGFIKTEKATKEIVLIIPIKDFENRYKFIADERIGDSYYGWSVGYPKGCEIVEKQTSGTSVLVRNQSAGYYYYIFNTTESVANEKELLNQLLGYVEDEKIVNQKTFEKQGVKWASLILEDQNGICEYRAVCYKGRVYQIHFYTSNKDEFMNKSKSQKYKKIIDSFNIGYKGNEKNTKDINEISNGFYSYYDKDYGWSIDLLSSMNIDIEKARNIHEIIDEKGRDNGITCGVEFYSLAQGDTLGTYVQTKVKELKSEISEKHLTNLDIQQFNIENIPAAKMSYEVTLGRDTYTFYDLYLISGQYKYNIYLYGKSSLFVGKNLEQYDRILKSFTPASGKNNEYIPELSASAGYKEMHYKKEEFSWC